MAFGRSLFIFQVVTVLSAQAQERVFSSIPQSVTQVVAAIDEKPITSREVIWSDFLSQVVFEKSKNPLLLQVGSPEFNKKVSGFAMQKAIYLEALNFSFGRTEPAVLAKLTEQGVAGVSSAKLGAFFRPATAEVREWIEIKETADRFIKFKSQSSVIPVTDAEAKKYFETNRAKFGSVDFDSVKPQIKGFLARNQVDQRMKSWFEILQSKYNYRNLIQ